MLDEEELLKLDKAAQLILAGERREACEILEALTYRNDPRVYRMLGRTYLLSNDSSNNIQNPELGFEYLHKAIALGDLYSSLYVGRALFHGDLVHKDYELAFKYLNNLKNSNIGEGHLYLAACYIKGLGVEKSDNDAERHLRLVIANMDNNTKDTLSIIKRNNLVKYYLSLIKVYLTRNKYGEKRFRRS
ncbi:hypothetical protein [Kangiella sp.]|uniref:tetratricopeptide repeat protein n=1 Tax=Kangiella sp. TaxID=1920245 RepID=UPI0019C9029B|nr:hypothetical protein [Kangiella sp.]MBD3653057.1 sel1 repeat family protein [Kangiella sp.]